MRTESILSSAEFDPRLPTYFLLQALFGLLVSFFGIPLIPVWYFVGRRIHQRQYESLGCDLTDRSLNVRRGFLFKVQKNIPLDKITDLAVSEGPILRTLGLCSLRIETAGGSQGTTMGQASLPGVVAALEFRDRVMEQRDLVVGSGTATPTADEGVLIEIRDILKRIERGLTDRP